MQFITSAWVKKEVIKRLVDRFNLSYIADIDPANLMVLQKYIYPTTSIDDLLKDHKIEASAALDLTGAIGTYITAWTVPTGKRWTLGGVTRPATTAATHVIIHDGTTGIRISASGTGAQELTGKDQVLKEGWTIKVDSTGNAGDGSRTFHVIYAEEDAF